MANEQIKHYFSGTFSYKVQDTIKNAEFQVILKKNERDERDRLESLLRNTAANIFKGELLHWQVNTKHVVTP